jgi:hypothetical protein
MASWFNDTVNRSDYTSATEKFSDYQIGKDVGRCISDVTEHTVMEFYEGLKGTMKSLSDDQPPCRDLTGICI